MCSSIRIGDPSPGFAPLSFVLHYSNIISTPLAYRAQHNRHSSIPAGTPFFPLNSVYCLWNSTLIHRKLTWIPISEISQIEPNNIGIHSHPPARSKSFKITSSTSSLFTPLIKIYVPAIVSPNEMGDVLDDIETMLDWDHSDRLVGLLFQF